MSHTEKMSAQREARALVLMIRQTREEWKAQRLHELAEDFTKAFESTTEAR